MVKKADIVISLLMPLFGQLLCPACNLFHIRYPLRSNTSIHGSSSASFAWQLYLLALKANLKLHMGMKQAYGSFAVHVAPLHLLFNR